MTPTENLCNSAVLVTPMSQRENVHSASKMTKERREYVRHNHAEKDYTICGRAMQARISLMMDGFPKVDAYFSPLGKKS
ncbi:hypothetical protein N7453_002061 [Penicillium expansum]|nr:hypothetical protein N7453_002061 [Penicillium expansum]